MFFSAKKCSIAYSLVFCSPPSTLDRSSSSSVCHHLCCCASRRPSCRFALWLPLSFFCLLSSWLLCSCLRVRLRLPLSHRRSPSLRSAETGRIRHGDGSRGAGAGGARDVLCSRRLSSPLLFLSSPLHLLPRDLVELCIFLLDIFHPL